MPLTVSFVIPSYNQARFIRDCLDSCLAQRVPGAEVLVVDGLSSDGTQDVLAGYGPAVTWRSQRDRGQSDAINQGVTQARGDIIAWINSDDYYPHDGVVRRVLGELEARPEVDIVHGDALFVDVDGRPLRRQRSQPLDAAALLVRHTLVSQPAVFFRRQLFLDVGALDIGLHWAMDYDLWLRMFSAARAVHYLPDTLACTRWHADAKTFARMWDQIAEVRALKRHHAAHVALDGVQRWRRRWQDAQLYAYWAAVRLGLWRAV